MLLALLDAGHVHHDRAKSWLLSLPDPKWATSPITENGFVRIISQPAYPGAISAGEAVSLLARAASKPYHEFWADDLSLLDGTFFDRSVISGPKQITDVYLLALAVKHDGCLVALDRSISLGAVIGAEDRHLVLP